MLNAAWACLVCMILNQLIWVGIDLSLSHCRINSHLSCIIKCDYYKTIKSWKHECPVQRNWRRFDSSGQLPWLTGKGSINPKSRMKYPQTWNFIKFSPPILRFLQAWGWTRTPEMWVFAVLVILLKQIYEYFTPKIFFSPSHLEHIASSGVKTDPGLLGLNATPGPCWPVVFNSRCPGAMSMSFLYDLKTNLGIDFPFYTCSIKSHYHG